MKNSIEDAMSILGISRATAYRLKKAGKLTAAVAKASPKQPDVGFTVCGKQEDQQFWTMEAAVGFIIDIAVSITQSW